MPPSERIATFYSAFQQRDAAAMAACYTPDATFRDPVFDLQGADVGRMWRMLCERGKDLRLEFTNVRADADKGSADWQAWYRFSKTGRAVHNMIHAQFHFRDGLICAHVDDFDFWRWSRQALGPAGLLLGWSPLLRNTVRAEAARTLAAFR
ncbi:MAG: nuclear transport factor 2 family protein [Rhodanobacteraceae bacterium]|nr:nuclear transport factor 2 family protein [Rhodanobacteraceae bacterium]